MLIETIHNKTFGLSKSYSKPDFITYTSWFWLKAMSQSNLIVLLINRTRYVYTDHLLVYSGFGCKIRPECVLVLRGTWTIGEGRCHSLRTSCSLHHRHWLLKPGDKRSLDQVAESVENFCSIVALAQACSLKLLSLQEPVSANWCILISRSYCVFFVRSKIF